MQSRLPETWMLHRFRSAFVRENLMLIVLGLLRESELSEWEILSLLHSRYASTPTAKEFRRLSQSAVNGGYASFRWVGKTRKLRISRTGTELLRRLEEEYRAIVSSINDSSSAASDYPLT